MVLLPDNPRYEPTEERSVINIRVFTTQIGLVQMAVAIPAVPEAARNSAEDSSSIVTPRRLDMYFLISPYLRFSVKDIEIIPHKVKSPTCCIPNHIR